MAEIGALVEGWKPKPRPEGFLEALLPEVTLDPEPFKEVEIRGPGRPKKVKEKYDVQASDPSKGELQIPRRGEHKLKLLKFLKMEFNVMMFKYKIAVPGEHRMMSLSNNWSHARCLKFLRKFWKRTHQRWM